MSGVSKSTIVRTVAALLVVVNLILKAVGVNTITIEEDSLLAALELLIEVAVIAVSWWYNNSFSEKAQKAQEYLEKLKASE